MARRTFGALLVLLLLLPAAAFAAGPRAVVELFTSQGCSSCPPADRLLGELAEEREDIIVLSMPVTIWDFLGWSDTLARPELTERQLGYSIVRGDREVYTPQVIVNGREDVVGSDREAILARVAADNANGPALPVPVSLRREGDVLSIRVGRRPADMGKLHATIWLLTVDRQVDVPIRGGENRGRKLTYHNVVRELRPVGMWRGRPVAIDLPIDMEEASVGSGAAVLVQEKGAEGLGPIVGAAMLEELHGSRRASSAAR